VISTEISDAPGFEKLVLFSRLKDINPIIFCRVLRQIRLHWSGTTFTLNILQSINRGQLGSHKSKEIWILYIQETHDFKLTSICQLLKTKLTHLDKGRSLKHTVKLQQTSIQYNLDFLPSSSVNLNSKLQGN